MTKCYGILLDFAGNGFLFGVEVENRKSGIGQKRYEVVGRLGRFRRKEPEIASLAAHVRAMINFVNFARFNTTMAFNPYGIFRLIRAA